jgi:tetratricopeptide (TPR) repeat protein
VKPLAITATLLATLATPAPRPVHAAEAVAAEGSELERGIGRFEAGQFAAAIEPLAAAHASDPADLDTSLLLGIAYYRIDDVARARPLLVAAAGSTDAETRDGARIFLGLLADAAGDAAQARGYYDAVARSTSALADSARALRDHAGGERFAAVLAIRPELDSNVPVLPSTATPLAGGTQDTDVVVVAGASVRPFPSLGLVIDELVAYRKQAHLADYDMLSSASSATWSQRGDAYRAALGYRLDASTLGGARYLLGHTGELNARRAIAGSFGLGAGYQLAARSYAPDAYAGYTGVTQTATARLSWIAASWELELGYVLVREATDDPALSATGNGGQLAARLSLGRVADLRLVALGSDRRYDAAAMGRHDVVVRADASLYVELGAHVGAVLGGSLLDNTSSAMDQSYAKWTAFLGLVVATAP